LETEDSAELDEEMEAGLRVPAGRDDFCGIQKKKEGAE